MVDITLENLGPIVAMLGLVVTVWGASRKFTSLDLATANQAKDIENNTTHLEELKKNYKELFEKVIRLEQKLEDFLNKQD